jgi:predicted ABC-type ATPase
VAVRGPFCLCLAGPNGSGKSTYAAALKSRLPDWIDPDEIAAQLAGGGIVTGDISNAAFRAARNRRVDYAEKLGDFGFETVFSHGSNVAFLRALRRIGYTVHLYFIATEYAQINIGRVRNRAARGGTSFLRT